MNKENLYNKIRQALNRHIVNDTTNISFVNKVIKLVKEYLKEKK